MGEPLQKFRHYQLVGAPGGGVLEMAQDADEVAFAAFDARSGFFVEIRILSSDLGRATPATQAFLALAEGATAVRHRCLLPVLDAGTDDGTPYYVTGLADGETLRAFIDRCAPLPDSLAVGLVADLVSALQALSAQAPELFPYAKPDRLRVILEPPELSGAGGPVARGVLADFGLSRAPVLGEPARHTEAQLCAIVVELLREMLGGGSFAARRELADARTLQDLALRLAARLKELGGREPVAGEFLPQGAFGTALLDPASVASGEPDLKHLHGWGSDGWLAEIGGTVVRVREVPGSSLCRGAAHVAAARSATTHHAFPIERQIESKDRLLVVEKPVETTLAGLVAKSRGFSAREFLWLAESLDRALEETAAGGRQVWGFVPEQIGISGNFGALHLRQVPTLGWLTAPYRYSGDGRFPTQASDSPDDGALYLALVRSFPLAAGLEGLSELLGSAPVPQADGGGRGGLIRRIRRFLDDGDRPAEGEGFPQPGVAEVLFESGEEPPSSWNPVAREVLRGERASDPSEENLEPSGRGFLALLLLAVFVLTAFLLGLAYYFGLLTFDPPRALPVVR